MSKLKTLTIQELKENLHYNPETGVFTRTKNSYRLRVGDVVKGKSASYISICVNNVSYYAHRLAWLYMTGEIPKGMIDHINGNRLDNRICNLRDVSNTENIHNQTRAHSCNKTGFLGVSFDKNANKYRAMIKLDGKNKRLGLFLTAEAAHEAYLEAKRRLHKTCTI